MAASPRMPTRAPTSAGPTGCSTPTRSPRPICNCIASRAAPGPGKSSCDRGWKRFKLGGGSEGLKMTKYTCTMMSISDIYYATLIAESDEQAKEMAVAEAQKRGYGG